MTFACLQTSRRWAVVSFDFGLMHGWSGLKTQLHSLERGEPRIPLSPAVQTIQWPRLKHHINATCGFLSQKELWQIDLATSPGSNRSAEFNLVRLYTSDIL